MKELKRKRKKMDALGDDISVYIMENEVQMIKFMV